MSEKISSGTTVRTTHPNPHVLGEWTDEAKKRRQWGARGKVLTYLDSHGFCYEVKHEDGTIGYYDPTELKVIED